MSGEQGPGEQKPDEQSIEQMESEIDDLLSNADSLVGELGEEVGEEPSATAPRDAEFFESQTDSEASLDVQIAQADADLADAAKEIGDASGSASPEDAGGTVSESNLADATGSGDADQEPDSGQVPQPVAEETKAEPAKKKILKLPPKKPQKQQKDQHPSGPPPDEPTAKRVEKPDAKTKDLTSATVDEQPFDLEGPKPSRWATLVARLPGRSLVPVLKPHAVRAGDGLCGALDLLDRPFHGIEHKIRQIVGWVALVFIVAAISILLFAIL